MNDKQRVSHHWAHCSDGALAIYFIHEIDTANIPLYSLAVVQIKFLLLECSRLLLQRRLQLQLVGGQHGI